MSKEYIEKEAALSGARRFRNGLGAPQEAVSAEYIRSISPADVVARDCYDKILAENDTMREQLAVIGKKLGDDMRDVKPVVRGEWTPSKERMRPDMCSMCGCNYKADRCMGEIMWNLCPNCGADMRGGQDEDPLS